MNNYILDLLTIGALLSGILVITSKNPVISVVFLISLFIHAAGYLTLSGITFVGISYIIIYVGAITVLFLFVIMMLNVELSDIVEVGGQYTKNLPLAILVGSFFIFEIYSIVQWDGVLANKKEGARSIADTVAAADSTIFNFSQIEALGQTLYTTNALWLIILSFILLLSMIAPIILSRKE